MTFLKLFSATSLALLALAGSSPASARASSRQFVVHYGAHGAIGKQEARRGHLVNLVGDRDSGLGFYALPARFRVGARLRHQPSDAIGYAVATEAGTHSFGVYGDYGRERFGRTLFNPVDGYGSPFFAGYYGPAGDPDEERGPFGRPYR